MSTSNRLTYNRFLGDVTESLSIGQTVERAGKVIVHTLLRRVKVLLV